MTNNLLDNVMGVLLPDELPSIPNLIHEFLKDETGIESVEDFDIDLANEIEVALAMAAETDGDAAGGLVHDVDSREQPQPPQSPPLNSDNIASSTNKVETATASASNAWIDSNMISSNHTLLNQEQYSGYPQKEKVREQSQIPFFANIPEQDHAQSKGISRSDDNNNTSDYIADSPTFHNDSNEENWSITTTINNNDENSNRIHFVAAAQLLADHSIRAGLERKSVEESYKLYQQYFEKEGVSSAILLDDGGMNI